MSRDPKHLLILPLDQLVGKAMGREEAEKPAESPDSPKALLKGIRKVREELDALEAELPGASEDAAGQDDDEASESAECPADCEGCAVCDE